MNTEPVFASVTELYARWRAMEGAPDYDFGACLALEEQIAGTAPRDAGELGMQIAMLLDGGDIEPGSRAEKVLSRAA